MKFLIKSSQLHFTLPFSLWAVLIVPLQPSPEWKEVHYSKIPANEVQFTGKGLEITVNKSSSPLFYHLNKPLSIRAIHVGGFLSGLPNLAGEIEGTKNGDDFAFRLGVVEAGAEKPNWFEKLFAPEWLKKLIEIFPDSGLSRVTFITIAQQMPLNSERVHPSNKYALEKVGLVQTKAGPFKLDYSFDTPLIGFALWLHSDGDDSQSSFKVGVNKLNLDLVTEQ